MSNEELMQKWKLQEAKSGDIPATTTTAPNPTSFATDMDNVMKHRGGSFLAQVYFCLIRSLTQQVRSFYTFALELLIGALTGGIMGVSLQGDPEIYTGNYIYPYTAFTPSPNFWQVPIWSLLIGLSAAFAAAPSGVAVFAPERTIYRREATSGHNRLAYYLGKVLSSLPRLTLSALHFASVYTLISNPITGFDVNFSMILLQFYGVYGLASLISLSVRPDRASLLAVVCCLFMAVFCGVGPSLKQADTWGVKFIFEMDYNKWAAEAFISSYLTLYSNVYDLSESGPVYIFGYTISRVSTDFLYMLLIGTATRVLGLVFLFAFNRSEDY